MDPSPGYLQSRPVLQAVIACSAPLVSYMSLGFTSPALDTMAGMVHVDGREIVVPSSLAVFDGMTGWASWFVSLTNLGGLFGSLAAARIVLQFGQRLALTISVAIIGLSWIGCILTNSQPLLCLCRMLSGFGIGLQSVATPSFIAAVAPPHLRGRLGTGVSVSLCIGVLISQVLGGSVFRAGDDGEFCNWRSLSVFIASCSAAAFLALLTLPTLDIASPAGSPVCQQATVAREEDFCKLSAAGLVAMSINNFCGIPTVINFCQVILGKAGLSGANVLGDSVTCVQLLGVLIATLIIDRAGRRPLLVGSCLGMSLTAAGLGYFLIPVAPLPAGIMLSLYGYVFFFSIGVGPVPWLLLPELGLPVERRITLASVATAINWGAAWVTTGPPFAFAEATLGLSGVFLIYSAICLAAFVALCILVPETMQHRRRGLEQNLWSPRALSVLRRSRRRTSEGIDSSLQPVR